MKILSQNLIKKSRKKHRCDLCGFRIEKGDSYLSSFIVEDGDSWMFKTHIKCHELCDKLRWYEDHRDYGVDANVFEECVEEAFWPQRSELYSWNSSNEYLIYTRTKFHVKQYIVPFDKKIEYLHKNLTK